MTHKVKVSSSHLVHIAASEACKAVKAGALHSLTICKY